MLPVSIKILKYELYWIFQQVTICTHVKPLFFRLGDLLCCETCSAVYHLACVDPPLEEVPDDDWLCSVCRAHQVSSVDLQG